MSVDVAITTLHKPITQDAGASRVPQNPIRHVILGSGLCPYVLLTAECTHLVCVNCVTEHTGQCAFDHLR